MSIPLPLPVGTLTRYPPGVSGPLSFPTVNRLPHDTYGGTIAVLQFMRLVSSHEGLESEAKWTSAFTANTRLTVAVDWHGLHRPIASIQWSRLLTSHD